MEIILLLFDIFYSVVNIGGERGGGNKGNINPPPCMLLTVMMYLLTTLPTPEHMPYIHNFRQEHALMD